jgi:hypothetical protein
MRPKASLDNCGNCAYWKPDANRSRGVCEIVSYPQEFSNRIAFISIEGPGRSIPAGGGVQFKPLAAFHCTLYKVK